MSQSTRSQFRLDTDLIALRALVAIADTRSFSAAAKRIGRSQSAVSLQIAKLEERTQTRLLDRTSRTVTQTSAGEILTTYARRILELADEVMTTLSAPADVSEPFRIGFAQHLVPQHLPGMLARFQRAHPKVSMELKLGSGVELNQALDKDQLDVVISGPEGDGGKVLLKEPLIWVAAPDHVVKDDEPVSLVLIQPPCSYRRAAMDALTAGDRVWRIVMEANAIEGVQSAVAAGLGVSVIARSAMTDDLQVLDGRYPKLPKTSIVAYMRSNSPHPLANRFISFFEEGLESVGGRP